MQTNQKTLGRKIVSVAMSALMIMAMIPAALATSTGQITNIQDSASIFKGSQITMTATGADNVTNHIDWAVEGYSGENLDWTEGTANISKHRGVLTPVTPGWIKVTAYLSDGALPEPGHGGGNGNLCPGATVLASVTLKIENTKAYGFQGNGQNSMKMVTQNTIRVDSETTENGFKKFNNTIVDPVSLTNGTADFTYELSAGGNQPWNGSTFLVDCHTNQLKLYDGSGTDISANHIAVEFDASNHRFTATLSGLSPNCTYKLTALPGMRSMSKNEQNWGSGNGGGNGQQGGKMINCYIEFTFTTQDIHQ